MEKREVNRWNNECSPFPYCALHFYLRPRPQRRDRRRRREQCIDVLIRDLQFDAGQESRPVPRSGPEHPLTLARHAFNLGIEWYHVQLALAGDTDDEYGWGHIDVGVDGGDDDGGGGGDGGDGDDGDDDDDEMTLAEV